MNLRRRWLAFLLVAVLPPTLLRSQELDKSERKDLSGDPLPNGALMRMGTTRMRHLGEVKQIRFVGDGAQVASIGDDHVFSLWDIKSGEQVRRVSLADAPGRSELSYAAVDRLELQLILRGNRYFGVQQTANSALSSDGATLAVSTPGKVQLLDTATGKANAEIKFKDDKIGLVALANDGKKLARFISSSDRDVELSVVEAPSGKLLHKLRLIQYEFVHLLAFSPDGKHLAGAGNANQINLWDLATGKRLRRYDLNEFITTLAFSPRDGRLASATNQGVYFWDLAHEEETAKFAIEDIYTCGAAFSPDGATMATTGRDNSILLWDVKTGAQKSQLTGLPSNVSALAYSADGKRLAAGTADGSIHVWTLADAREITPVRHEAKYRPISYVNSRTLLVKTGPTNLFQHLDLTTGKIVKNLFFPPGENIYGPLVADNGKFVAHLDPDKGDLLVFDAERNKALHKLDARGGLFHFSPDCALLAALGNDRALQVWDTASGKRAYKIDLPTPDEEKGQQIWRIRQMQMRAAFNVRATVDQNTTATFAISQDNRFVVALGNGNVATIWELATGKERARFVVGAGGVAQMILSHDGRLLATVSTDDVTRVWDLQRGQLLHAFVSFEGDIRTLAFARAGQYLATGSSSGAVVLYDLAQGKEKRRYYGHRAAVNKVLFAPQGSTLLSAGEEGTMLFWDLHAPEPPAKAPPAPSADRLAELWNHLAHADAGKAYSALSELNAHPALAVKLLRQKMKPVAPIAAERLPQLLTDLRESKFAAREKATQELIQLDAQVVPVLEKALKAETSTDVSRRIKTILEKIDEQRALPENLRVLRAVEVLERIGNAEALALLESLAGGAAHARLSVSARESLVRLRRNQ